MTAGSSKQPISIPRDCIVVVHGFAGKRLWMYPLCFRLRSRGFRVTNWGYPSLWQTIAEHAGRFREYLAHSLSDEPCVHIIAHSMGAIVVRSALAQGPLANLGRVILFAPPNQGTPVARHAARIVGRLSKGIGDLSDQRNSYVNRLPGLHSIDVGIVAARFDMLVPVACTHVDGERQHVVLNATHNSLLLSRTAVDLALSFIATGSFCSH